MAKLDLVLLGDASGYQILCTSAIIYGYLGTLPEEIGKVK